MKIVMKYYFLIAVVFLLAGKVTAQEENNNEESKTSPIEFPEFIIEGKERINVPSGVKQYPNKPEPLTKDELDSLNPLRKQQTNLIPQKKFPGEILHYQKRSGFLRGEFGRFSTPSIEAAYGKEYKEYFFYGKGEFESSGGDVKNSDYTKMNIELFGDYIAPDKYWIFGGSKTRFLTQFDNKSYNLYGSADPVSRNQTTLDLGIHSEGTYEDWVFSTGAGFKTLQTGDELDDYSADAFDNRLNGYLEIKKPFDKFSAGGNAEIDFGSVKGEGVLFLQAGGFTSFQAGSDISLKLAAGLQTTESQAGVAKGGLRAEAEIEYRLDKSFTLRAGILSGLEKNSFYSLIRHNPYISTRAAVEFPYNVFRLKGFLYYHPSERFSLSGGIKFGVTDDTPVFVNLDSASFITSYQNVSKAQIILEGFVEPTNIDDIVFNITANITNMSDNNKMQPYIPQLKFSASYKRQWIKRFGTIIGFDYIGERYTDLENEKSLDGYIDLKTKFFYNVNKDIQVFLNFENLLNSDIYIWNFYKERSLFFSAGLFWKF